MRRSLLASLFILALAAPAAAQVRPANLVPDLDEYTLSSLITGGQGAIERCASRTNAGAYVATVRARVSPGSAPSTLYGARIALDVISRPRSGAFEGCVRAALRDSIRHAEYAVPRSVRAQHTFQIAERPTPPIDRPPPPFDADEVRRLLSSNQGTLQQCLEVAGIPEEVTLRVAVRPDGMLVLTSADVPPGAGQGALGCLSRQVSRLRTQGRPARTVNVVHRIGVRNRAY